MLPVWFIVVSLVIRLYSGGKYAVGVLKGIARPNPVTWFLWGLTSLIAFCAQSGDLQAQSFVTLALGVTPIAVCVIAIAKNGLRAHCTRFTLMCGLSALVGIVLWQITDSPALAIVFAIVADILASLPTLSNAYDDPASEYSLPYLLSVISMVTTLLTIKSWIFTIYAFPLYMLCINVVLYAFAAMPIREYAAHVRKRFGLMLVDGASATDK
jgi:hypothetical protein